MRLEATEILLLILKKQAAVAPELQGSELFP